MSKYLSSVTIGLQLTYLRQSEFKRLLVRFFKGSLFFYSEEIRVKRRCQIKFFNFCQATKDPFFYLFIYFFREGGQVR